MPAEGGHPLETVHERRQDQRDDPRKNEEQQYVEDMFEDERRAFTDPDEREDDREPHERPK